MYFCVILFGMAANFNQKCSGIFFMSDGHFFFKLLSDFSRIAFYMFFFLPFFVVFVIILPICTSHQNPPVSLLFTTYHDIRLANITRPHGPPTSIETIAKDLSQAGALDFFYEKQLVCWSDQKLQRIQCMKLNGTHPTTSRNVITSGLEKPEVRQLNPKNFLGLRQFSSSFPKS